MNPLYKRTVLIVERHWGADNPFLAEVLEAYAWRLRKTDREGEAEPLEARAKAIRSRATKPGTPMKPS